MSADELKTNAKQANPPRMTDLLNEVLRGAKVQINCIQVGIIKEFDPAKQLATIQIAMKQVAVAAPDGTKILQDYPLLLECPVFTLSGGGSFISLPIAPGDSCLVLFNDRDIDQWSNTGAVVAPQTGRVHNMTDAFALVGVKPAAAPIGNYLADGIRIFFGAEASIDLKADGITINGNTQVNGNLNVTGLLSSDLADVEIVYNTHTHGGIMPGGSNTSEPNAT